MTDLVYTVPGSPFARAVLREGQGDLSSSDARKLSSAAPALSGRGARDYGSMGRMKVRSYLITQRLSSRMRSACTNASSTPNRAR